MAAILKKRMMYPPENVGRALEIVMEENGTVSITGKKILIDGEELVRITGKSVKVN